MKKIGLYAGVASTVVVSFSACLIAKIILDKPEGLLVIDEDNHPYLSINRPPETFKQKERIVLEIRRLSK